MSISQSILETLLYEEESETLDFKQEQYSFEGASNEDKSELLKDILSMANAWRRTNAYILVGVKEEKGDRSIIKGVSHHLEDASLQQFVNSKTQRPLHFSYIATKLDGKDIAVIEIPLQDRPLYLNNDYGKLKKGSVYIKRGSSTDIASPDEIVKMGQYPATYSVNIPLLNIQFFDVSTSQPLGNSIQLHTKNLKFLENEDLPDYGEIYTSLEGIISPLTANKDYYRELVHYLTLYHGYSRVDFQVENEGSIVAKDVKVELKIENTSGDIIVCEASDYPMEPPSKDNLWFLSHPVRDFNPDIWVESSSEQLTIFAELGKIQPKSKARTYSGLYVSAIKSVNKVAEVKIFADNLPSPRISQLFFSVSSTKKTVSLEDFID